MTTEKAIQLLHRLQDEQFDGIHGDERREALEMAVRVLSGDGDTISRQQAIDAVVSAMIDGADAELVEGIMEMLPSAQPEITEKQVKEYCEKRCFVVIDSILFHRLKSAQPERTGRWISEAKGKTATLDEFGNVSCSAHCSECGDWLTASDEYDCRGRFCPSCGARMDGKSDG